MLSRPDFLAKNIIFVFADSDERLSVKNDNLIVKDGEGNVKLQKTCYRLFSVWIMGKCIITSGLMQKAKKFGFSIQVFSYGMRPLYCFLAKTEGNVMLRKKQYHYTELAIAQELVSNKIGNQIALLKRIRSKSDLLKEAIVKLRDVQNTLSNCADSYQLMGKEGSASKVFFGEWYAEQGWSGRKPRAKNDINNVLLDLGYTLLFHYVESFVNLYGFDTYCGVYHKFFYQRKSLVCDLVEPFRCIIDLQLRNSYNLGQIDEKHFSVSKGKYRLDYKHSKHYTALFVKALVSHKEEVYDYVKAYYRYFLSDHKSRPMPQFIIR